MPPRRTGFKTNHAPEDQHDAEQACATSSVINLSIVYLSMRWMLPGHSPSLRLYPSLNAQGPSAAGGGNAPHFFATCAEHFARGMLLVAPLAGIDSSQTNVFQTLFKSAWDGRVGGRGSALGGHGRP